MQRSNFLLNGMSERLQDERIFLQIFIGLLLLAVDENYTLSMYDSKSYKQSWQHASSRRLLGPTSGSNPDVKRKNLGA